MAIFYKDIKLMKSQRLDDTDEGGGRMTGNEVVDGELNNLFPDVSRLDRTYGRVQLRKAFPAIMTDNDNPYYGAHIIITKPAVDKNVKCCMFTTKSSTDTRRQAVDRVEQYVVKGYRLATYKLMGKHVAGCQQLLVEQNISDELPAVNSCLYIEERDGSKGEYIKIQKVKIKKEDSSAKVRQIELTLWAPIQYEHEGFHEERNKTIIDTYFYNTLVADAAKYYGISKLVEPAQVGDSVVKVESIFHQLVPCAQSADALSNRNATIPFGDFVAGRADGQKQVVASGRFDTNRAIDIHCLTSLLPGSVEIWIEGYASWTNDNGEGQCENASIDYVRGIVSMPALYIGERNITVKAIPAVLPNRSCYTICYPITLETQTTVFTRSIRPFPKPGSFFVKYLAQGNWYTLWDQGDGTIKGASPAYGSGTIDYEEGVFNVTLGALPDVGSSVIFGWGTDLAFESKGGEAAEKLFIELSFSQEATPGTISISYTANGETKTVTDDGKGNLSGDGIGEIHYVTRKIKLYPNYLPDAGTAITVSYHQGERYEETQAYSELIDNGDGTLTMTLAHAIVPGSLELEFPAQAVKDGNVISIEPSQVTIKLKDDGKGHFLNDPHSAIIYQNGRVTFSKKHTLIATKKVRGKTCWEDVLGWVWFIRCSPVVHTVYNAPADYNTCDGNPTFTAKYIGADTANGMTEEINDYKLATILHSAQTETIVERSLWLRIGEADYIDKEGSLYQGINPASGVMGERVGTVDYTGAKVELDIWPSGVKNDPLTIKSLVIVLSPPTTTEYHFVTGAAPLQIGSFQLLFTRADTGELVSVIADNSGEINGNGVYGHINWQTGICDLWFGEWVPDDEAARSQWWYDETRVRNGQVLKPIEVYLNSIKYNAVAIEFIPLDPSILGLNPLRLPVDGRVPIFRKGDVVVIHNIQETTLPNPVSAGQTYDLGRGNLSYVDIFDQKGKYINRNLYEVDLENGTITFADPLDLSEYEQPLIAYHRREDMRLLVDVQIDGTLKLIQPLEHDYDTDFTYVSSALLMGDLQARVYNVFDQKNWTGEWSDERIGDPCTANYNLVDYPIEITNKGAIQERWAIIFTSETAFKVVGETVGQIATGFTTEDCAPINPATGVPYFRIRKEGWGSGWRTNNVLRFNTTGAHFPIWIVRTILIGDPTADDDSFRVQIRGDTG